MANKVVYDDMVKECGNKIFYNASIDEGPIMTLIEKLMKMEKDILKNAKVIKDNLSDYDQDMYDVIVEPKPIMLYITSYGGCISQAFVAVDFIKNMKVPVHTICSGAVMSAGTILSMAGKKRYITKHTFMMIHELRTGSNGPLSFITDYYNNNTLMDEMMKRYYVTNTKIPMEEIVMILKQDVYWDAETCLLKGLVDEIM